MLLLDFHPQSEAVVKKTKVETPKYPVFDFHTHMGKLLLGDDWYERYDTSEYIERLKKRGVYAAVNLDGFYGDDLLKMNQKQEGTSFFTNFMWVNLDAFGEPDFASDVKRSMMESYKQGARGVKLWKDISLYKKIRIDDPRLNVIYATAAELGIPVLMHVGDPVAFFKKKDRFNERFEEIDANPDWDFSNEQEYFRFEELMEMQENVIREHPKTTFVIAHVGSYAENLEQVGKWLSKYLNMNIDLAARFAELGRVPYSARKFFVEHQDQILFGTDSSPLDTDVYPIAYRFLETFDEYFSYTREDEIPGQGRWMIYGIGLDDVVLKKIYYQNACRLLKIEETAFLESTK